MSAEAKAISAVLKDKQIHVLLQGGADTMFTTHQDIWEFIKEYAMENGTLPPEPLVVETFRDFEPQRNVGSTKHHMLELREEYVDRTVRSILRASAEAVQEGDTNKALETLISSASDLKRSTASVKDVDLVDLDSAIDHFKEIIELNKIGNHGVTTGLHGFDAALPGGITPGQLGIFLALPAKGKSFLALFFAAQAWKQGKTPLVISLEMSESEVRNRLYAILGEGVWSLRNLDRGDVELDMFEKWHKKTFENKPPFYIISTDGVGEVTTSTIRSKIDQYKPDFVVFDYMQLGMPDQRSDNEVQKMKNLSRELKMLAINSRVPILAISSATPTEGMNTAEPPMLSQTAWSRQIAYDADWVLSLGREDNGDVLTICLRKNRHGVLNEMYLQVDFDSGNFRYMDSDLVS